MLLGFVSDARFGLLLRLVLGCFSFSVLVVSVVCCGLVGTLVRFDFCFVFCFGLFLYCGLHCVCICGCLWFRCGLFLVFGFGCLWFVGRG